MSSSVAAPRCFLDAARLSCGGEYDDEEVDVVRDVIMTVPVFLTLIVFSAFTSQVNEISLRSILYSFSVSSRPYFSKGRAIGMSCRPSVRRLVCPSVRLSRMYGG